MQKTTMDALSAVGWSTAKREAPTAARNSKPIGDALEPWLKRTGLRMLEIASGTGQHAAYLAGRFPGLTVQPSDITEEALASIREWAKEAEGEEQRVLEPLLLDTRVEAHWAGLNRSAYDVMFVANMLHISPWEAGQALCKRAGELLVPGGIFCLYGPFKWHGQFTTESNEAFDSRLRARDASWGYRDVQADLLPELSKHGLQFEEKIDMPANNFLLRFRRRAPDECHQCEVRSVKK